MKGTKKTQKRRLSSLLFVIYSLKSRHFFKKKKEDKKMPKKIGIDEKIAAQEGIVERAKAKLDAAEAKLGELKKKKEAEKKKELLDAIDASDKTVDEVMTFLNS